MATSLTPSTSWPAASRPVFHSFSVNRICRGFRGGSLRLAATRRWSLHRVQLHVARQSLHFVELAGAPLANLHMGVPTIGNIVWGVDLGATHGQPSALAPLTTRCSRTCGFRAKLGIRIVRAFGSTAELFIPYDYWQFSCAHRRMPTSRPPVPESFTGAVWPLTRSRGRFSGRARRSSEAKKTPRPLGGDPGCCHGDFGGRRRLADTRLSNLR